MMVKKKYLKEFVCYWVPKKVNEEGDYIKAKRRRSKDAKGKIGS